jgi:hypothetical protein
MLNEMMHPFILTLSRITISLILMVFVMTTVGPDTGYSAFQLPDEYKEFVRPEITVDVSDSLGKMPEIFKAGVYKVNEEFLTKGARNYLHHKFLSDLLPGMTTITIPLHAESFVVFKRKVEKEGILLPQLEEAKRIMKEGGRILFDFQMMPRWLSSNLVKGEFWRYPPKNYDKWKDLVAFTTDYLYENGAKDAEYRIWEEVDASLTKDLKFWNGTKNEFYKLYKYSVQGIRSVDADAGITFGNANAYSEILYGMIDFTAKNKLPLDYILYHPFGVPPYTADYQAVVKNIRSHLVKAGLDKNTPIHAESWNSWLNMGRPDLKYGQPDERSYERDTEYDAAFAIQTLYSQDAGGITYQSFFSRVDPQYRRYRGSGLVDTNQQFYGDWGMFTRDMVIKPVYNAFQMLSILSGKKEHLTTDRLKVIFDEKDYVTGIASQSRNRETVRILLAHNIEFTPDRAKYYKRHLKDKYFSRYSKKHYGDTMQPLELCVRKSSLAECIAKLPQDIQPYMRCVTERKKGKCRNLAPKHMLRFDQIITGYLQHSGDSPKEVILDLKALPFKGRAILTTYTIDGDRSNSCRYNKRTERYPTPDMCGVNGDIDNMVREARAGAVDRASKVVRQFPSLQNEKKKIVDSLFYFGKYTMPDGKTAGNTMWIDKINNNPNVSLEGSRQTKKIVIRESGSLREMITLQPYGVVLIELSKM